MIHRFLHALELSRMGANIEIESCSLAKIKGVKRLFGTSVKSHNLRSGAALILAGLASKGETVISEAEKIYRGYQDIEKKLQSCGAQISSL